MNSIPFLLSRAVVAALESDPTLAGAVVHDNPRSPSVLADGPRVLFVEDKTDGPAGDQANTAEMREFTITVGAINRTEDDRDGADQDMVAAKAITTRALTDQARALEQAGQIATFQAVREGKRGYRLENIDVGGALILTEFSIQYRLARQTRRATL